MWDCYLLNFDFFHEHFLTRENIFQKVLINNILIWQIVLNYKEISGKLVGILTMLIKINNKVLFTLELPG